MRIESRELDQVRQELEAGGFRRISFEIGRGWVLARMEDEEGHARELRFEKRSRAGRLWPVVA